MTEQDKDFDAKTALTAALTEPNLDYGNILKLAHKLSEEDKDTIRFSVDASHISRLGLELVSKQETAISELIKNAYDADTPRVEVDFYKTDTAGGVLEIIDYGTGMSREQLLNGFMRISTAEKVTEPLSPKYGRQRAGRKGIGRFAAQRLGRKLSIVTQQDGAQFCLKLTIDWDKFLTGIDLHMIASQIIVLPAHEMSGTTMRIEELRDSWSEAQIRRAFRFVSDLLQPFKLSPPEILPKLDLFQVPYAPDPGFVVNFYKTVDGDREKIASHEQNILSTASGYVTARVENGGQAFISLSSSMHPVKLDDVPLKFDAKLRTKSKDKVTSYNLLDGIQLSAHYFIADELPQGTRGMVRDILNRTGGIRIYRNGFRVLPYGESFDDWLSLQRSSALREVLPPHHNTNFLGFVEITDVDGNHFQETASREGLIENEAFHQLQDFAYRTIIAAVMEIARVRGRKLYAGDKSPTLRETKTNPESVKDQAAEVAGRLRAIAGAAVPTNDTPPAITDNPDETDAPRTLLDSNQPQDTGSLAHAAQELSTLADEIELIGQASESALQEVGMLRVLASLGLTIGEFTHEVRHALAALGTIVTDLNKSRENSDLAEELTEHVMLLRSYMHYFDDAVMQNAHRKLEAHELRDVISEFIKVVRPTFTRQNVKVETSFQGYDLFTKPMHKSEWASTLLNLFTNSLKAIHRAQVKGTILISCSVVDGELQIDFSDNGDGIPVENREKIFDAFFTTSAPPSTSETHEEQLVGTGLGLKIVRDIIEAAGGSIEAIEPAVGYSTCIRLTVPKAREDQIDADQY
ncbi:sensor histidine kinase [Pseudomonas viridiflava]|uniref:sensor histidine kinase n=1 Tax=Pseudomonas viridiflava TaxID=33069 RepID=UPI0018E5CEF4|nr:sensor histidine kinase [Pseudomonas viridiflava]MBI6682139.1 sensor histidine kinase [Pseudomonas viridiflava]MEE4104356.1 sensor histidine kinase [Pseudomonas viridiflava]